MSFTLPTENTRTSAELKQGIREYAEEVEAWKLDHMVAMACLDLQALIIRGNAAFDAFDRWRQAVSKMMKSRPESEVREFAEYVQPAYRAWLKSASTLEPAVLALREQGHEVEGVDEVRKRVALALIWEVDLDVMFGPSPDPSEDKSHSELLRAIQAKGEVHT